MNHLRILTPKQNFIQYSSKFVAKREFMPKPLEFVVIANYFSVEKDQFQNIKFEVAPGWFTYSVQFMLFHPIVYYVHIIQELKRLLIDTR